MSTAFAVAGLLLGALPGLLLGALLGVRRREQLHREVARFERAMLTAQYERDLARADLQLRARAHGGLGRALAATDDTVRLSRVDWPTNPGLHVYDTHRRAEG